METTDEKKRERKARGLANLKPAKPGDVRNPGGVNVPKDIAEMRRFTNQDVERKIHFLLQMNAEELKAKLAEQATRNLEKLLGMVLYKAMANACVVRGSWILERAGCRLPPQLKASNELGNVGFELTDMSDEDFLVLGEKTVAEMKRRFGTNKKQRVADAG